MGDVCLRLDVPRGYGARVAYGTGTERAKDPTDLYVQGGHTDNWVMPSIMDLIASVLNAGESDPFQPLCFQVIAEKERSAVEVKGEFCIKMGRDTYVVTQGESLLNRINTMGNVCRRRK